MGRSRDIISGFLLGSTITALLWTYVFGFPGSGNSSDDDDDDDGSFLRHNTSKSTSEKLKQQQAKYNEMKKKTENDGTTVTPRSSSASIGGGGGNVRNMIHTSFLTLLLEQLWPYIKVAAADMIRETVEPSLAALPGPMKTCRFIKVDLGPVPITMDNIIVHPEKNGSVQFDMDIVWDGDCDIQLKADFVGKFGVKNLKISGRMAIIFQPLTTVLPCISAIQYCFINPPHVELSFSGLASIADLSVMDKTVKEAIQSSLSILVLPNRNLYKMMTDNNFLSTYVPPIGVARVTIKSGRGFEIEKRMVGKDDIPDVYANISTPTAAVTAGLTEVPEDEIWRTSTISNNCNPVWTNEHGDFLLYDHEQMLTVEVLDSDTGAMDKDDELGNATITIGDLLIAPNQTMEVPLTMYSKKAKGEIETGSYITLSCELLSWTSKDLSTITTQETKPQKTVCNPIVGLLYIIINRAFDLPLDAKTASTYVKATFQNKEYDSTTIYDYPGYDSLNPIYDSAFTIPIVSIIDDGANTKRRRNKKDAKTNVNLDKDTIQLELIQGDAKNSTILGSTTIPLKDLTKLPNYTLTEKRPMGDAGAILEFRVSLSGVSNT